MPEHIYGPIFVLGVPALMLTFWAVVAIAQWWLKVRRGDQEAALKQEMIQRGLSVEEIERLLLAGAKLSAAPPLPPTTDWEAVEQLAACLGECSVAAGVVAQVLTAVRSADPASRQATCRAVLSFIRGATSAGAEITDEQILAVVRGLSQPAECPAPSESPPSPEPPLPPGPDGAFQPMRPA